MLALRAAGPALKRHAPAQCRRIFSFPSFQSGPEKFHESRVLPYSQKELYAVVADVASYPKFIPFCTNSRIDKQAFERAMQGRTVVEAQLSVGFMNFTEQYTSIVTCEPFKSVQAVASSSTPLFKTLATEWRFHPQPNNPQSTLVSYSIEFEFANILHAAASSAFFGKVSGMMIKAFEERCQEVYGSRT